MDVTRNDWWAAFFLFVTAITSWISFVLMLQPRVSFFDALGTSQWAGLGFSIGLSVLSWFRLITIRTIDPKKSKVAAGVQTGRFLQK